MSLRPSEEPYTTIARLRAEVERLKSEEECPACGPAIDRAEKAESERDEALSEVERLHYKSILYEGLKHRISQLERERDEAQRNYEQTSQRLVESENRASEYLSAANDRANRLRAILCE